MRAALVALVVVLAGCAGLSVNDEPGPNIGTRVPPYADCSGDQPTDPCVTPAP